ncbi:MAG: trypsin-like peptidase domain-containing protein [Deltaproteobacteria bacterium]|nr:trypsin-like peptidase domain-containing protein [Deltaproteobacteria bacterium]
MVRVTTASGTGAGFFIDGPDGYAYVATANHVVDRGERILVERDVGTDKHAFVEAYPQTEIVASDPDADLAIIRIKNVEASRFQRLPLAKEPIKDTKILAYGYPGSSLAKHAGLMSKDGKILSLASFPAYDQRYNRIVRENAVDGLLISADIEPGFSGGPTCNEAGEVVGVNVTKDRAHVGQNGAVSVVALNKLMQTVKPASVRAEPTPDDVVKLLEKIQSEYLLLPLEERSKVRETDFLASADLPSLRRLVGEVRREERNTDTSSFAKYQLSGQAALGMFFARLPGKLLETYRSPNTTTPLAACELTTQHLTSFLGDLSTADKRMEQRRASAYQSCDELAVRPLAWDLVAATLQWDGREKEYTVTKLDRMDEDEQIYRASLRISGASNLIEVWIAIDQHSARLKLFDTTDALYAIKSPRSVPSGALQGTWSMKRPRVTDAINKDAEIESTETLSVSMGDDRKVSLRHVITERYFGAGNHAKQFKCNRKATIETGLLQSFTGTLDNGVVVALPEKTAEPVGADAAWCEPSQKPDRIVAVKLQGDQLVLYRTDGNAYPQAVQLTKE